MKWKSYRSTGKIICAAMHFLVAIVWIAPFTGFAAVPLHLNAPLNFETGPYPTQVFPMDLDGDGDQDVAVKGGSVLTIPYLQLFENSGDGMLIAHSVIQLPHATQIIQADINRDGCMDLLGAYHGNQGGELLTLTQTESFSFSQDVQSLPFSGRTMCVGDLDGVNGPDLVIGDDSANPVVHIYLNDGAGSFSPHGSYETEAMSRDVDGDGLKDQQGPIYLSDCKCGDIDGDGDQDLVVINSIQRINVPLNKSYWTENIVALFNRGDGTFGSFETDHILWDPITDATEASMFTDPIKGKLRIEDMDNDGDCDVVATVLRHSAILIRNQNNEGFAEHETVCGPVIGDEKLGGVKLCDVDSDGDLDLGINVMLENGVKPEPSTPPDDHPTDFWVLFLNSGSAIFSDPIGYRTGADLHDLAFADLNGDNRPDALTVASDDKRLSVYYNEAGRYPRPVLIPLSGSEFAKENIPKDIASGDFNDDGWMDLAVISRGIWGDNTLAVFNGGTNGISTTPFHVQGINLEPFRILADQLAANPNTDIAYIHGQSMPSSGGLNVVLDDHNGEGNSITLNGRPYDLAAVDMNSDDILDLAVVASSQSPTSSAFLILCPLAADGSIGPAKYIPLGTSIASIPICLTSADMDDDRLDDLVVFKYDLLTGSADIDVFLNKDNFKFDRVPQVVILPWPSLSNIFKTDMTAADVTGDGLPDLIVTYLPSNQQDRGAVRIYPNSGGGYLPYYEAYSYNLGSGTGPFRVAAAQMDNANGLDLVVSNDDANELNILFNDGYGGFLYQESYMSWGGTDALTIADFDQDGDNDVALCHHDHFMCSGHFGSVSILFNRLIYSYDPYTPQGEIVTSDLWIRAVINTVEKGPIDAIWKKGGEDTTSRGDRVIWGHFYASPNDVSWGSKNNPDLFVKIWFDVSGRVDVNYFHVSVPDIEVYSDYPYDGTSDEQGTTTMERRYIRHYYENGESNMDENYEDGNPPSGYSPTGNPFGYSTINDLRIGSIINTVEKGSIDALWRLGGQDTTSRGDQVVWGHFYASPSDVTWGSSNNPDLFMKIWFDVSGRVDVNFFHVSVPDIEVYSALPDGGSYDQKGTTIMDNRYIRHEYWK